MRLVLELLVALPRFCRQRTALGTCRPVVTWKLPHHTWGEQGTGSLSQESWHLETGPVYLFPPEPTPPHCSRLAHGEGWKQGLCELGLEGVQELFGAGIVERQEAWGKGSRLTGVRRQVRTRGRASTLGWWEGKVTVPWWKSQCTPRQSGTGLSSTLTLLACLAVKLACNQLLACRHQDAAVLPSCSKRPRLRYATPRPKALLSGSKRTSQ